MMLNRRKMDDDLRLTGWKAVMHKVFMAVSYPFRKPLIFAGLLAVLFLAPTFRGVKPAEVHVWYKNQIVGLFSKTKTMVEDTAQDYAGVKPVSGLDKVVDIPDREIRVRKGFEVASSAPAVIDVLSREEVVKKENEDAVIPLEEEKADQRKQTFVQPENAVISFEEEKMSKYFKNLDLRYLDKPLEVMGEVKVHSANDIEIDGVYMFLYGIYVTPNTVEGIRAEEFLRRFIEGKRIRCSIVAYTKQDVATAMCVWGRESINHLMIEEGFSRNVAIDMN